VSWASSEDWRSLIHIEEAVVVILTMDAFGQVEAGHLKLRCQRLKCGSISPTYSRFSMTLGGDGVELGPSWIYPDISPESFSGYLFFQPVLRTCPPTDYDYLWGLVLERSKLNPYTFSRVGAFKIAEWYDDGSIQSFLDFDSTKSTCGSNHDVGAPVGVNEDRKEEFCITII
jgi:hypothetical protein